MLIQFDTPKNLNGEELVSELSAIGVTVTGRPQIDENKDLWLDIKESDKAKALTVIAVHNGTVIAPEPTIADKLALVGLSIEELKIALGGN